MKLLVISKVLGLFILLFSISLVPPLLVSAVYHDHEAKDFLVTLLATVVLGLCLWWPLRNAHPQIRGRDGFVVVAMYWLVLSFLGAIPFMVGSPKLDLTDAVFEAVSGFTTTGATVIIGLDRLPPSVLFYRQELQWLGGIGVVVAAVAVLPMLGIGGMQLYRAETPGPMKQDKLTPRITSTARSLWVIYLLLTAGCTVAFWLAGMPLFDAISHSFATVSTGGFSTHDDSLAYFHSAGIEFVAIVFMLLGALNFGVHYVALVNRAPSAYWHNTEIRVFLSVVFALSLIASATLFITGTQPSWGSAARYGLFEIVSVITSTGFAVADFSHWPLLLPALIMISSFIGGCAGSTAGGIKVIRFAMLAKQTFLETVRLMHPRYSPVLKFEGRTVGARVIEAVRGFFIVYGIIFMAAFLLAMASGIDSVTAFSAVATCLNNTGPGLGTVSVTFAEVNDFAKWVFALTMLFGRLELFTLLVLLVPQFWTR